MRLIALLALLLPSLALAQVTIGPGAHTGPRILGEASTGYCPMLTHGKCTDNKTIATTRSTPVPCGSGTAGVDVGCYEGGLGSWEQVVNYALQSTNAMLWDVRRTPQREALGGGWVRVTDTDNTSFAGVHRIGFQAAVGETVVASAIVRAVGSSSVVRLAALGSGASGMTCGGDLPGVVAADACHFSLPNDGRPYRVWLRAVATVAADAGVYAYFGNAGTDVGAFDIAQGQVVKGSGPGRRCDAGAVPASCAADKHLRGTEEWPTTKGRISFMYAPESGYGGVRRVLLDADASAGVYVRVESSGRLEMYAGGKFVSSAVLPWLGRHLIAVHVSGPIVRLLRDGVEVARVTDAATLSYGATASIGHAVAASAFHANGKISRLEWSNQ